MLSIPHQKFCEGIVSGLDRTAAYSAAFPHAAWRTAQTGGSKLYRKPHIQAEITRLRGKAQEAAGSAVLSHIERRAFLARLVRAASTAPGEDADLGRAIEDDGSASPISTRDKILALKADAELAPPPIELELDPEVVAFHAMICRVRATPWERQDVIEVGRRTTELMARVAGATQGAQGPQGAEGVEN